MTMKKRRRTRDIGKTGRLKVPPVHYANMPLQYTAIFQGCKNENFQMKHCDIVLIFAQNIDCQYTLEPPH